MKRYEKYKDSGVKWLGEVPENWNVKRLASFFEERREKVSDKDYAPLSVTKNGILPQLETAAKSNDGDNRKLVRVGDFVINSRSDRKGSSGVSRLDGSVSLINIVMKPEGIQPKFCNYLLKSHAFIEEYYRVGRGIVADLWTTRFDEMKLIQLAVPSLTEQQAIAEFLDDKTSKIDQAISIKEKEIVLLKERRQILIQELVTGKKIWDGNKWTKPTKTKDSGVNWIGEIPEDWEVRKLKYLGTAIIGLTYAPEDLCGEEEGTLVMRSSNLNEGKFVYGEKENAYVKKAIPSKLTLKKDDILICSRNGSRDLIGKCAIVSNADEGHSFGAFTTVFRSKYNNYLFCILNSNIFKSLSGSFLTSTINQLTIGNLNSIQVPIPSSEEMVFLQEYIESIECKFTKAVFLKQQEIEKLKEYKTVLIDNVVTGKIKVC